jgi:hypothetical protein
MLAVVLMNVHPFVLSKRFRWLMCASLGSGTAVDVLVTAVCVTISCKPGPRDFESECGDVNESGRTH